MALISVEDFSFPNGWHDSAQSTQRARECCEQLEAGNILLFPGIPYDFPPEDIEFLLSQKEVKAGGRKNIIYDSQQQKLLGIEASSETAQLRATMQKYSQNVSGFLARVLAPYQSSWLLGAASYRPEQEQGRDLETIQRNDLMHTDAFKTTPIDGGRIFRCFTNINPDEPRIWNTTDAFPTLIEKYAEPAKLLEVLNATQPNAFQKLLGRKKDPRLSDSSLYNSMMLRFHDFLKLNEDFQQNYPKQRVEFPPNTTWMCFTDAVPHAALSGRFALEQTVFVPLEAMVTPEQSPARVLEKLTGRNLINV